MSQITLGGNPIQTSGTLPEVGTKAKDFTFTKTDLSTVSLADFAGKNVILNIFPSIDTDVCAASVRKFNEKASGLENTTVLCVSRDLPFAQKRFCGAEGIENVEAVSDYVRGTFGLDYGLEIVDPPLKNLHSRAVIVIDGEGTITHAEQVPEIAQEPDYEKALAAVK